MSSNITNWDNKCEEHFKKMCEIPIQQVEKNIGFKIYAKTFLPIVLIMLGSILMSVYASSHADQSPLTFKATMASISLLCIGVNALAITYFTVRANFEANLDKERRLEIESEVLSKMMQQDADNSGNVRLNNLLIPKNVFNQKQKDLSSVIAKAQKAKSDEWSDIRSRVDGFINSVAIFLLALLGTIFASEYLPRIMDADTAKGVAASIGIVGLTGAAVLLSYRSIQESYRHRNFVERKYQNYYTNYLYVEGLEKRSPQEQAAFPAAYKRLLLERDTKATLLSWWIPLMILMFTISLGVYERTLEGSAYLISTSTVVGTALIVTHIVYSCLTIKWNKELQGIAEYEITHSTADPIPQQGH